MEYIMTLAQLRSQYVSMRHNMILSEPILRLGISQDDFSQGISQPIGVLDAMTEREKLDPKLMLDSGRAQRVADGASVQPIGPVRNLVSAIRHSVEGCSPYSDRRIDTWTSRCNRVRRS